VNAADYAALAAAVVSIIGAIAAGAVSVINALKAHDVAAQARHDETIAKLGG
jgi:hypothetical protein